MSKNEQYRVMSFSDFAAKLTVHLKFLFSHWRKIILIGCVGAALGVSLALLVPINYTAKMSFVAEENKLNTGGLASIAGQFGLDLSAAAGAGTFFSGDNLLLFLKSEGLIRQTLLTTFNLKNSMTLADRYAEFNGLFNKWRHDKKIGEVKFIKYSGDTLPRSEDSLLQIIIKRVNKRLIVQKPERKANFIEVSVTTSDEMFSKLFIERLVQTGVEHYVNSKTRPKADNVFLLQQRADSLATLLNKTTSASAYAQQPLVDVNPALRSAVVPAEIQNRNKIILLTLYSEVLKNLELAKFALQQDTPVIQIVDKCYLPLKNDRIGIFKAMFIGLLLGVIGYLGVLIFMRWWNYLLYNSISG
jgi:hypothetical protein